MSCIHDWIRTVVLTQALALLALPSFAIPGISGSAYALEPRQADLLSLRLGMKEASVSATLTRQGISPSLATHVTAPCASDRTRSCQSIVAQTRDGVLTIGFAAEQDAVSTIGYRLNTRNAAEQDITQASALERFGPARGTAPLAWCSTADASGTCPASQPRLVLERGPGPATTLTLSDGLGGR